MATEFNYTREWTDAEAFPLLSFTKNWENPEDYPTYEPDEMQVRRDMQSLHDEVKDFLNNELIPRVIAEDATVEGWEAQETARSEAESARSEAETARADAEQGRVDAEAARVQTEAARVETEAARATAESARVTAETGRVEAEAARVTAEQNRATVESARVTAEAARAAAESARVTAEANRESAESGRAAAEAARSSAETARSGAEAKRVSAEQARVSAEKARVDAESSRAREFAVLKTDADTATTNANTAADKINKMTVSATDLTPGSAATVTKGANENGGIDLKFGIPEGAQGKTGNGIKSINKTGGTGAAGTYDTYTITMADGSTFNFRVLNGANGKDGTGDMVADTYDPQGKRTDIFAYVEEHGGAQSDWNQTDESAPDYVKNRTHHDAWSANKFAQEIAFTTNDGATFGNFNQSLGLEAGKTYTILCDGDEYTGVAEAVDVFGTTAVRVGDFDAIGGTSETMSAPICVCDMREGGGVVFLKETFTEETSKFVVVLEGKNKEEYWSVALDPAESPLYNNMFVASWKPVPYSDFAHGFSAVLSIDGVEYSVNDADPKVFVISTPDGYWTLHYDSIMVALCSESAIMFINDTQAGLNNTPQVDMKKLTFNVPVFAPSMELKKLDSKYLPTPSWNDLADKPFGDVDVVFLDEEALAFEGGYTSVGMKSFAPIGSMVTVVLDGTTYTWQVVAAGQDSGFGNLALLGEGEDTGESLCGVFAADLGGLILMSADAEASSHAVKITGKDVVKLPTKYYNSTVYFYASTDGYLYLDVTRTTKATRSDVEQVVGKIPITVVYGLTFMQAIAVDCSSTNEFVTVTCYRNGNFDDYHTAEYTGS